MGNHSHIDRLRRNVSEWNQWRDEHPRLQADLGGADLNECNLRSANLSDAVLEEARLHKADLTGANLKNAKLSKANLMGAILHNTNVEGADFTRADLAGAHLRGTDLRSANLSGVRLAQTNLEKIELQGCLLSGANFDKGSILSEANLSGSNLSSAILMNSKLDGATLSKARLPNVTAPGAVFAGAKLDEADLTEAELVGCDLSNANMRGAVLNRAKIDDARLVKAALQNVSLVDAHMEKVDFSDADLTGADLSNAWMRKAKLSRANLRGATLIGTQLTYADFSDMSIDRSTALRNLRFADDHDEMNDGSDTLKFNQCDRILNWSSLRFLSEVPLFGASYVALGLLFVLVHGVHAANVFGLQSIRNGLEEAADQIAAILPRLDAVRAEHPTAAEYLEGQIASLEETLAGLESAIRGFSTHIPPQLALPSETIWAILSAVLLVMGTTIYAVFCPATVKRFSETEWVAQLRRPRLLYIADSLGCRPSWAGRWLQITLQFLTGVCVTVGGLIAIVLLVGRILKLFQLGLQYSSWA